jgi:hypothetical protein
MGSHLNRWMMGVALLTGVVTLGFQSGGVWHRSLVWMNGGIWCSVTQRDGVVQTLYGKDCTLKAMPSVRTR